MNTTMGIINQGIPLESNGGIPVNIQDQTTRPFSLRMAEVLDDTISLAATVTQGAYTFDLSPGHGVTTGESLLFAECNGMPHLYWGSVLNVSTNTITLDTPAPYPFIPGEVSIYKYSSALNVNGSSTPRVFRVPNVFETSVDITRILFHIRDDAPMDPATFGGLSALTRGLVFRKSVNSSYYINYWNVKTNGNFAEIAYDTKYDDRNLPPAGLYGFTSRITYAGQEKHGVVIRLAQDDAIEIVVQDDLTGLSYFSAMLEGHFVQD